MSERDNPVFVVATANDVSRLPPELLRKGRFDEFFFVDLPTEPVREIIFGSQVKKRCLDPAALRTARLSELREGYSGAEIEQAIVASQCAALAEGGALTQPHIEHELARPRPLSVIRAEDFERLRDWACQRCVMVD